jgi:hypothetical protein
MADSVQRLRWCASLAYIRIRKREQRKPYGARPPALNKFAAAFLIIRERQQKAVDEKPKGCWSTSREILMLRRAGTEFEGPQEIEQTFDKDFKGIGLS